MTHLSIRARLTLWYTIVLMLVLVIASLAVSSLHGRLGRARIDAELAADLESVRGVMRSELAERRNLIMAARETLEELNLPGVGVAIVGPSNSILAATLKRAPVLTERDIVSARSTLDFSSDGLRRGALSDRHGEYSYTLVVWKSMDALAQEAKTLRQSILFGVPIALALAGLGGWTIASRSLKPLSALAAQADRIDHGLDDVQLRVPNPEDELGLFARAFNRLLERVASLLRTQRAFMADASHQLRTPVSVIRTTAEVTLSRSDRTNDEYRESLEIVARQSLRLTKMVDDMFMLAMVDVEARPLQPAPLYLNEVLDSVARDAGPLASDRGISVVSSAFDDISLVADEDLVRQMIWNLVENAVRYGRTGGTIQLSVHRSASTVEVTIEDDGPGIAAADRTRVFDRFVRLETAGGAAGAGLGLPIARWIAQEHRGSLVLDDTARGCRFRIVLPVD
jgi:two-component system, OmpR family, sensor kinase